MEAYHFECCFSLASAHGSAPIMDGNGAFLGVGAGFIGTMEAELDDAGCSWIEGLIDGAGGQPCWCLGWAQAGWICFIRISSSVTPEIQDWTFSCSSMIWVWIPFDHRRQQVASKWSFSLYFWSSLRFSMEAWRYSRLPKSSAGWNAPRLLYVG